MKKRSVKRVRVVCAGCMHTTWIQPRRVARPAVQVCLRCGGTMREDA